MMCGFRDYEVIESPGLCMCQWLRGKQENSYFFFLKLKTVKEKPFLLTTFLSLFGITISFEHGFWHKRIFAIVKQG